MKLISKKCPNCGANLSFNEDEKKIKCEYCKQDILIERDKNDYYNSESFRLRVEESRKAARSLQNKVMVIVLGVFIVIVAIAFLTFTRIFKASNKIDSINSNINETLEKDEDEEEDNKLTKISQINDKSLELLKKESLEILKERTDKSNQTRTKEWEYIGLYFLNHKTMDSNQLYVVYKGEYTIKKKKIEVYAAVSYSHLELTKDKEVVYFGFGFADAPMQFVSEKFGESFFGETVFGYYSNKDLYNELIKSKIVNYEVTSTPNIYTELES